MQGVKEKLDRDEIEEINHLLESYEREIMDLGEGKKLAKLKLHQQKVNLYTQLFNSENDVKYRKKMLKEYKCIFNIACNLKSLDIALQSVAKIVKVYGKLGESSKAKEWKKKEEEVKSDYSRQPDIIINKINKIEKDIRELTEDIIYDELKSTKLHIEVLKLYEQLCKSEVDKEYHKKYADHLKIFAHQLYNQRSYDEALSCTKKLIETCKYLGRDEEVKRHMKAKNKLVELSSQPGVTASNTPTSATSREPVGVIASNTSTVRTPRNRNSYRESLEKTPSVYSTPEEAFQEADPRAVNTICQEVN